MGYSSPKTVSFCLQKTELSLARRSRFNEVTTKASWSSQRLIELVKKCDDLNIVTEGPGLSLVIWTSIAINLQPGDFAPLVANNASVNIRIIIRL